MVNDHLAALTKTGFPYEIGTRQQQDNCSPFGLPLQYRTALCGRYKIIVLYERCGLCFAESSKPFFPCGSPSCSTRQRVRYDDDTKLVISSECVSAPSADTGPFSVGALISRLVHVLYIADIHGNKIFVQTKIVLFFVVVVMFPWLAVKIFYKQMAKRHCIFYTRVYM